MCHSLTTNELIHDRMNSMYNKLIILKIIKFQVDWDVRDRFFFMPRFVRDLSENGKEILSMNEVISYLVKSYQPVVDEMDLMQVRP